MCAVKVTPSLKKIASFSNKARTFLSWTSYKLIFNISKIEIYINHQFSIDNQRTFLFWFGIYVEIKDNHYAIHVVFSDIQD